MTLLFLQEEPRLWRAALVICKLNVLLTQHHFWAEVQMRLSVTPHHPKGSLPPDSVVLCVAPGVSQLPGLAGDHKHDRKIWSGYLGHLNREGQFLYEWFVYHCFTLLCSQISDPPAFYLFRLNISEDETFYYHTLMEGILIIITLLSPTVMLTKTLQV